MKGIQTRARSLAWLQAQVTDTPGLLARPDELRNRMELLTLATLACLPTSVLFVMDLTEECGTSVQDQWAIRWEATSLPHVSR